MRPAKFQSLLLIFAVFLILLAPPAFSSAGPFSITLENDTLSVTAEKTALQTILLELAAEGIIVKIDPAINHLVSVDFKKRPIEQGLEALLKPASYSLVWETVDVAAGQRSLRLAEIQVFETGRQARMKILQPPKAEVIAENEAGIFYVKDEILLYIPVGTDLAPLHRLIRSYDATLVESRDRPGLFKVLLPENSDVFAITREIKNRLNPEIAQPNYAYPIQSPVRFEINAPGMDIQPGYFAPTDNSAPIAILDSGLAADTDLDKFVFSSLDVLNPAAPLTDTLGHGTQMAYIASGVVKPFGSEAINKEPYIPIVPIRAFDDNGFTTDFKIMDAINFALKNNARVMSLSWGSETGSALMEKAFAQANAAGLIIVASAGNEPTGKPVYPAAYPSVIGVGALGPHGKTWENSNFGSFVALYAPGFANLPVGHKGDPGLYAGTSISAAFVANAIAGYLSENPAATPQEIQDYLNEKF